MVGAHGGMENFVLPVRIRIAHQRAGGVAFRILRENRIPVFIGREHIDPVDRVAEGDVAGIADAYGFAEFPFFGRDEDDARGGPVAIDGGCRSVLEHRHRLDVVGVDDAQRVAAAGNVAVVHRHPVDDDKRVVGSRERRFAPDPYPGPAARTAFRVDGNPGDLARQQFLRAGDGAPVEILRLHGLQRSGGVFPLNGAVTDHHNFFQVSAKAEFNIHHIGCADGDLLAAVASIAVYQGLLISRNFQ